MRVDTNFIMRPLADKMLCSGSLNTQIEQEGSLRPTKPSELNGLNERVSCLPYGELDISVLRSARLRGTHRNQTSKLPQYDAINFSCTTNARDSVQVLVISAWSEVIPV
jgi:hypothetical protein